LRSFIMQGTVETDAEDVEGKARVTKDGVVRAMFRGTAREEVVRHGYGKIYAEVRMCGNDGSFNEVCRSLSADEAWERLVVYYRVNSGHLGDENDVANQSVMSPGVGVVSAGLQVM
jgi:hypothetical protein